MSPPKRMFPRLNLDFRSGIPAYLQIFRQIQKQASSRRLQPGDRLPTVRELAALLGVNFNTVARAYRLLDRAGVVSAQQGRGTFAIDQQTSPHARSTMLQTLTAQYIAASRRSGYSPSQIASAVADQLRASGVPDGAGDSHG